MIAFESFYIGNLRYMYLKNPLLPTHDQQRTHMVVFNFLYKQKYDYIKVSEKKKTTYLHLQLGIHYN